MHSIGNPTRVIAITGPAAVGKSTLARELQKRLGRDGDLWLVMDLDAFARGLPSDWVAMRSFEGRFADRGFRYERGEDERIEIRFGADARRVLAAFHRAVATTARSGLGVICETIVYDADDWLDWCESLADVSTCWVRLDAPLATLEEREREDRTRVLQGLARGTRARPRHGVYTIEADTNAEVPAAIATRILATLGV